jgi:hypothetical protein
VQFPARTADLKFLLALAYLVSRPFIDRVQHALLLYSHRRHALLRPSSLPPSSQVTTPPRRICPCPHAAYAPAPTSLPLLPTLPPRCTLRGHRCRRPTQGSPGCSWPGAPPTPGPSPWRLPPPPWRGSRTTGSMREEAQRLEEKSDLRAWRTDPGKQGGVEECADAVAHDGSRPGRRRPLPS